MDAPDFLQSIADNSTTYEIDSAAASITVMTPVAGKRFRVHHLFVQAEAAATFQVLSGATDLSGPINIAAANGSYEWKSDSGLPVFKGRASAAALVISNPGTIQLNGFAVVTESAV